MKYVRPTIRERVNIQDIVMTTGSIEILNRSLPDPNLTLGPMITLGIDDRNSLPQHVVSSNTVNTFKIRLDRHYCTVRGLNKS